MDSNNFVKFLTDGKIKPRGKKWRKERMQGKEIGNYVIQQKLGKGGTSVVYKSDNNGQTSACKITDGKYCENVIKEYEILRSLNNQNILQVFDCISCNRIVAMAMESVNTEDLHDYISHKWPLSQETRRKYAGQLLSAVDTIHSNGVAHCDLKLENILINCHGDLKLIDFGSALRVAEATFDSFAYIATTPEYLPPEIICARVDADGQYDIRAIDEWSVGIVLFIMLTGRFPFGEVDQTRIAKYIKRMRSSKSFELRQREESLIYFEREYLEMVRGLLSFDDEKRLPVAAVLKMAYFKPLKSQSDIEDEIDKDFEDIFGDL